MGVYVQGCPSSLPGMVLARLSRLPTFRMFSVVSSSFNDVNCSVRVSACVCAGVSFKPSQYGVEKNVWWLVFLHYFIFSKTSCALSEKSVAMY